jgi:hypothetical protein
MAAINLKDATIKLQSTKAVWGAMKERGDRGGACRGMQWRRFGRRIDRQKIREKIHCGLKRMQNDAKTHNNQPQNRRHNRGQIQKGARPAGSAGGGCNVIVLETIDSDDIKNKLI